MHQKGYWMFVRTFSAKDLLIQSDYCVCDGTHQFSKKTKQSDRVIVFSDL